MKTDEPANIALPERTSNAFEGELLELMFDQKLYAIPSDWVRQCRQRTPVVRIPDAPCFIEGAIDLRGDVVPVIDFSCRLGAQSAGDDAKLAVMVANQCDFGLQWDRLGERFTPDRSLLHSASGLHREKPGCIINGMVRDQGRVVLQLDLVAFLDGISHSLLGEAALSLLPGTSRLTARRPACSCREPVRTDSCEAALSVASKNGSPLRTRIFSASHTHRLRRRTWRR